MSARLQAPEVTVPPPLGAGRDWRRVAVYGLGLSGLAAGRLLRRRGVEVVGFDSRPAAALELGELARDAGFATVAGSEPDELPEAIDALVLSPGVPPDRPLAAEARRRGLPVVAEVELAFPLLRGSVAAITGSNGKSTTTALTGAILRAAGFDTAVCGNIGEPLSAAIDEPGDATAAERTYVVELSSFQLEGVDTFHPRAAALLNLAPDHLDRYDGLADYLAAKRRIFARQQATDVAVLNADDEASAASPTAARRRYFSTRRAVADGCFSRGESVFEASPEGGERELFARGDLPLAGAHNLENAMAAALLARALGADADAVRSGMRSFRGLPHRMERVAEAGGITWYDDSKGTNAAATAKSLAGFADGTVHLILGGRAKGEDPAALAAVVGAKASRVYLIGEAAEAFADALGAAGSPARRVPIERSATLDRAVSAAAEWARPGEVVLLSPACASFDQFQSFAHRGREFRRLVAEKVGPVSDAAPVVAPQPENRGGPHGEKAGGR